MRVKAEREVSGRAFDALNFVPDMLALEKERHGSTGRTRGKVVGKASVVVAKAEQCFLTSTTTTAE